MRFSHWTDLDSRATVVSIDGISAVDHISRATMLDGLSNVGLVGRQLLFVRQFFSESSQKHWTDDYGDTHPG